MSPAGRPRIFDEEAVLNRAMEVFWEQGYEAATLSQLKDATGLSSASLYGAFGSKAGLFARAVQHYVQGPGQVTEVAGDAELPAAEALAQMLHASISMQADPAHPIGCLVALSAVVGAETHDGKTAREAVMARRRDDRERITACVRRGISDGSILPEAGVLASAALIHTFLLGLSTQLRDGVDTDQLHAAADSLVDQLRPSSPPPESPTTGSTAA
ncbi:TetR/AcrR family transcriptional regulator [Streptomonospora sediminis]